MKNSKNGDTGQKKKKSLKAKMLLYFLVMMTVVLAAVGVIIISNASSVVVTLNNDMTEQVVLARADEIGKYVQGLVYEMRTWADGNVIRSGDIDTIKADIEKRQATLRSDFETVLYSDMKGDYVASTGGTV